MTRPSKEPNYRSQLERRVCNNLRNRGVKFAYEPYQISYTVEVKPAWCPECGNRVVLKERSYTPDVVLQNDVHIEIKGKLTGEMRTKMVAIKECNPDLDIRLLFQRDNWLSKKRATKYSQWAERNGFIYHIGETVPSDWVD